MLDNFLVEWAQSQIKADLLDLASIKAWVERRERAAYKKGFTDGSEDARSRAQNRPGDGDMGG